jgi:hypothetical protein
MPHVFGTCPNCGRLAETVPERLGNRHTAGSIRRQPLRLDANLWTEDDRIVGIGSAILLISLFLPWFGITLFGTSVTEDGLTSHGYLSIVMIICLAILGYLVLRISPMRPVLPPSRMHELLFLAATAVNFVLVIVGFIATPGGADWAPLLSRQFGSFVGGVAALTAVVPWSSWASLGGSFDAGPYEAYVAVGGIAALIVQEPDVYPWYCDEQTVPASGPWSGWYRCTSALQV